ncbi:DNA breaking-rejoining enzyme [Mycena indigotica]|uniref:DNA breaking-rejoining enzyme n=1 Tax=Mycena indigotica TaxID=2126181 RepID=A0A8H6SVT2_9AGAR|nr:DNA breaking-rejoining enzyme [Mycena indigotica]KAF7306203.1 DNA breaking-rejoining enzyme [Mycena indigotica]
MTPTTQHPIPPSLRETHDLIQLIRASDRSHHASPATSERKPPGSSGPILAPPPLSDPHPISPPLRAQLDLAFQNGWGAKTLTNYGYAVDRFLLFCDNESVPAHLRLPTHEFILSAYPVSYRHPRWIYPRNDIAALKPWHIAQKQPWLGGPRLHYVLSGVDALSPQVTN